MYISIKDAFIQYIYIFIGKTTKIQQNLSNVCMKCTIFNIICKLILMHILYMYISNKDASYIYTSTPLYIVKQRKLISEWMWIVVLGKKFMLCTFSLTGKSVRYGGNKDEERNLQSFWIDQTWLNIFRGKKFRQKRQKKV